MFGIKYYGVRGSIPTPIDTNEIVHKFNKVLDDIKPEDLKDAKSKSAFLEKQRETLRTIGGNSSCVRILSDESAIFCDAGTGLRVAGLDLLKESKGSKSIHIFLSHTHWDHIMGFPFFAPAYIPGYEVNIYSCHDHLKQRFEHQQIDTHFPVSLDMMAGKLNFIELEVGKKVVIADVEVTPVLQDHPGDSYAYVFEKNNKKVIYATDSSYQYLNKMPQMKNVYSNADAFIFDAMYTFLDYVEKIDWGHSSSFFGVDFCARENIKNLILFHHEPMYNDEKVLDILDKTQKYKKINCREKDLEIRLAIEGETLLIEGAL